MIYRDMRSPPPIKTMNPTLFSFFLSLSTEVIKWENCNQIACGNPMVPPARRQRDSRTDIDYILFLLGKMVSSSLVITYVSSHSRNQNAHYVRCVVNFG